MKKIFFVFALAIIGLTATTIQSKAQSTFQKEQPQIFIIRASQSNAKQSVSKVLSSLFGMNFGTAMKQLGQGGTVILPLKTGVTKEEAATIKSALEAAGAEVEVK
ncbi:ribosomal protein L7/L12 [Emticicia sp. W12TSBA100-4]|uniref:ribosomal protein L7/L12 n=1 Tax=Emticicia sp. W12TSBA100-4 TaxID=3160965 RepID=UPI0033059272